MSERDANRRSAHAHAHGMLSSDRAFAIGVVLNTVYIAFEVAAGLISGSLALLADAGHNASDVVSLLLVWGASCLARTASTDRYTYGRRRATILASLANGILLLIAIGAIAAEAIGRLLLQPADKMSALRLQTGCLRDGGGGRWWW